MDTTTQAGRQPQPAPLREVLGVLMADGQAGLVRRYELAQRLRLLLCQLLPAELAQHCRMVGLSGGVLTIEVESPAYLYELRISSHQLFRHLRRGCPAAGLRTLRIVLAR
jgi:hypothetical protein